MNVPAIPVKMGVHVSMMSMAIHAIVILAGLDCTVKQVSRAVRSSKKQLHLTLNANNRKSNMFP